MAGESPGLPIQRQALVFCELCFGRYRDVTGLNQTCWQEPGNRSEWESLEELVAGLGTDSSK